jgi:hypothetical protein
MLQIYGGVWITPDCAPQEDLNRRWQSNPVWERFSQALNRMTGTSPSKNIFENFAHLEQFTNEQGFRVEKYSMLDVLDQLTCLQPLGIDFEIAKSLLINSFVLVMSIHNTAKA